METYWEACSQEKEEIMGDSRNKAAQRQLIFAYLDESEETRLPLKKFLKLHKMQRRSFYNFEGEYKVEKKALTKQVQAEKAQNMRNTVMDAWDKVEGRTPPKRIRGIASNPIKEEEKIALARKVYDDAMTLGASSRDKDLAVRMLGMLIEKSEMKVGLELDADTYSNIGLKIIQRLRDDFQQCGGNCPVCSKLFLLPEKIREDKG